MCEDIQTPARGEIVAHEEQQRRFTSFYISDILAERSREQQELTVEENNVLEVDGTREATAKLPSEGIITIVRLVLFYIQN